MIAHTRKILIYRSSLSASLIMPLSFAEMAAKNVVDHSNSTPIHSLNQLRSGERILVVDAGAFIHKQALPTDDSVSLLTTSGVLKEVRDPSSRLHVALLPQTLKERVPTADSIRFVREFATKTGDGGFLSANDVGILALAVTVARESGVAIRERPVLSAADAAAQERAQAFRWNPEKEDEAENSDKDGSSSSDDGEWITVQNFSKLKSAEEVKTSEEKLEGVFLVTGDYSVQNVSLQMGIPVLSYEGLRIRSVKQWGLLCVACWNISRDTQRAFCPSCGTDAIRRVAITTDAEGKVALAGGRPRRPQLKGTIYSIPKRKGGRDPNRLILAEDELMIGGRDRALKREQRQFAKVLEERLAIGGDNDDFSLARNGSLTAFAHAPKVVAGYGRRNPNAGNFRRPASKK